MHIVEICGQAGDELDPDELFAEEIGCFVAKSTVLFDMSTQDLARTE